MKIVSLSLATLLVLSTPIVSIAEVSEEPTLTEEDSSIIYNTGSLIAKASCNFVQNYELEAREVALFLGIMSLVPYHSDKIELISQIGDKYNDNQKDKATKLLEESILEYMNFGCKKYLELPSLLEGEEDSIFKDSNSKKKSLWQQQNIDEAFLFELSR